MLYYFFYCIIATFQICNNAVKITIMTAYKFWYFSWRGIGMGRVSQGRNGVRKVENHCSRAIESLPRIWKGTGNREKIMNNSRRHRWELSLRREYRTEIFRFTFSSFHYSIAFLRKHSLMCIALIQQRQLGRVSRGNPGKVCLFLTRKHWPSKHSAVSSKGIHPNNNATYPPGNAYILNLLTEPIY